MPCYPDDTKGVRGDAVDSIITRIRSGRSKFRDLVPLLASTGLPLEAKDRLYSAYVPSIMLYESETWTVK